MTKAHLIGKTIASNTAGFVNPLVNLLEDAKHAIQRNPQYGACAWEGDPGRDVPLVERIDEALARLR